MTSDEALRHGDFAALFIEVLGWDYLDQSVTVSVTEPGQLLGQNWNAWGSANARSDVRRYPFQLSGIAVKCGLPVFVCSPYKEGRIPSYLMRCEINRRITSRMTYALLIFRDEAGLRQVWQWVKKREDGTLLYCEHTFVSPYSGDICARLDAITFTMAEEDRMTLAEVLRRIEQGFGFERTRLSKMIVRLDRFDLSQESAWLRSWVKMAYRRRGIMRFEERRLIEEAQQGDKKACERLVEAHLYLPLELAWKFKQAHRIETPLEDLIHEGYFGLWHAVRTYRYTPEKRFQQHAAIWIWKSIGRTVMNLDRLIPFPVYLHEQFDLVVREYDVMEDRLTQSMERQPTEQEMAHALSVSTRGMQIVQQMRAGTRLLGVHCPVEKPIAFVTLAKVAGQDGCFLLDWLKAAQLTAREQEVLVLRFGLFENEEMTLQEVGERLGVTRERVRQIELRALEKLREWKPGRTPKRKCRGKAQP